MNILTLDILSYRRPNISDSPFSILHIFDHIFFCFYGLWGFSFSCEHDFLPVFRILSRSAGKIFFQKVFMNVAAFENHDVDGVMIARACLGRPWLFAQAAAALRGQPVPPEPTLEEQRDVMLNHYRLVLDRFGEEKGTVLMRKYACCYAQGKPGARFFRTHVAHVSTAEEFYETVRTHFPKARESSAEPVGHHMR